MHPSSSILAIQGHAVHEQATFPLLQPGPIQSACVTTSCSHLPDPILLETLYNSLQLLHFDCRPARLPAQYLSGFRPIKVDCMFFWSATQKPVQSPCENILLNACSSRKGVIGVEVIGGLEASNMADHASTCCWSAHMRLLAVLDSPFH